MLPDRTPESFCYTIPINLVGRRSETLCNDTSPPWRKVQVRSEPTGRAVGFTSRALGSKRPPQANSDVPTTHAFRRVPCGPMLTAKSNRPL